MNYIYLRSKSDRYSLATQEESIKTYMHRYGFSIDGIEIEISPLGKSLDEREEFRDFIHSLKPQDRLFVYDLRALSHKVGEVVAILNCIFNHELTLYVCKYGEKIDKNTPAYVPVSLLNELRRENRSEPASIGRPKGSISRSKYDKYRPDIIRMLQEGKNVSEIAKTLSVSRSSIRDYILSRDLKTIALGGEKKLELFSLPTQQCNIDQKKG